MTDWFPDLDPPPGGLRTLRARLDAPRRPWWPVLLVAAALVVAVLWPRPTSEPAVDAGLLGWAPPSSPVSVPPGAAGTTAVARVPVDVVWYRVASTTLVPPPNGG